MTTRPRLKLGRHLIPGLAAVALFVVMGATFLSANFPAPKGFSDGSITASIGYAMFNLQSPIPSEGFLVTFEIIDVVLVAALVAAVMLAFRDDESSPGTADTGRSAVGGAGVRADGGNETDEEDN